MNLKKEREALIEGVQAVDARRAADETLTDDDRAARRLQRRSTATASRSSRHPRTRR